MNNNKIYTQSPQPLHLTTVAQPTSNHPPATRPNPSSLTLFAKPRTPLYSILISSEPFQLFQQNLFNKENTNKIQTQYGFALSFVPLSTNRIILLKSASSSIFTYFIHNLIQNTSKTMRKNVPLLRFSFLNFWQDHLTKLVLAFAHEISKQLTYMREQRRDSERRRGDGGSGLGRAGIFNPDHLRREINDLESKCRANEERNRKMGWLQEEIGECQANSQALSCKIQHLEAQYQQSYQEYTAIVEPHNEDIEDEIDRTEASIDYLTTSNAAMKTEIQLRLSEKRRLEGSIREHSQRRQELNLVAEKEKRALQAVLEHNSDLEEEIRVSREEYLQLQQSVFELDQQLDNLRKYGSAVVPEHILSLVEREQALAEHCAQTKEQIAVEQRLYRKLVPTQVLQSIEANIEKEHQEKLKLAELKAQRDQLLAQREGLNKIKEQYEWNPSSQVRKQLEQSRNEAETSISSIERQIAQLRRRTTETRNKVQECKDYSEFEEITSIDSKEPLKKTKTHRKEKGKGRHALYEEIRNDLQSEKGKKSKGSVSGGLNQLGRALKNEKTWTLSKSARKSILTWALILLVLAMVVGGAFLHYDYRQNQNQQRR